MEVTEKRWGLNAFTLKLMAMAFMLCDHLWATVVPGSQWLTCIGRLAFPIFAFQIVEGYFHTSDFRKYVRRMFLFALVSEIPYNLMTEGGIFNPFGQNVMFTFWISLLLLGLLEKARKQKTWVYLISAGLICLLGYVVGTVSFVDYHGSGVLMVLLFYFCRGRKWGPLALIAGMLYINTELIGGLMFELTLAGRSFFVYQQAFAVLALIPIFLYNGRQGPHSRAIQMGCYLFYPLHMLVLALIWLYVIVGRA